MGLYLADRTNAPRLSISMILEFCHFHSLLNVIATKSRLFAVTRMVSNMNFSVAGQVASVGPETFKIVHRKLYLGYSKAGIDEWSKRFRKEGPR
ncbi:MAG: hypothetical protein JSW15_01205 [Deltaproteobacteria bacterium]|nr:MAG: hypothetical protein JSW15_01205 [Deltaproteobacteria bacterium]